MDVRLTRTSARTLPATEPKPTEPWNGSSGGDYTTTTKCIARCTANRGRRGEKRVMEREKEKELESESERERSIQRGESPVWSKRMDVESARGAAGEQGEENTVRRLGQEE